MEFYKPRFDEYEKYVHYYKQCMHLCSESSFVALWSYQDEIGLERAFYKDLYWHRALFRQGRNERVWLPPIGEWKRPDWKELFEEVVPDSTIFDHIPIFLTREWEKQLGDQLEITEMRDKWDYLYYVDWQIKLEGSAYKDIRKDFNKFEREYNYEYSLITPEDIPEIIKFQHKWMEQNRDKDKPQDELWEEHRTNIRILENWNECKSMIGAKLTVDGKLIAYITAEELDDYIVSGHMLKCDYSYKGVVRALQHMFYTNTLKKYSLLNAWDDEGLEYLRNAKLSTNPMAFIKKYSVLYKRNQHTQ